MPTDQIDYQQEWKHVQNIATMTGKGDSKNIYQH